jgi:hypothetical protein
VGLALFSVAGAAVLLAPKVLSWRPQTPACVAVVDVGPYEIVADRDVACGISLDHPPNAVTNRAVAVGHYTRGALTADKPIPLTSIGPPVPHRGPPPVEVVAIHGDSAVTLDGNLAVGSRVTLLFGSLSDGTIPAPMERAVVLDVRKRREDQWMVILAISRAPSRAQAGALLDRRVVLVRS